MFVSPEYNKCFILAAREAGCELFFDSPCPAKTPFLGKGDRMAEEGPSLPHADVTRMRYFSQCSKIPDKQALEGESS